MRPSYLVLALALVLGGAIVALGPAKGRSVEEGFRELTRAAASLFAGEHASETKSVAAAKPPVVTVSQPATRQIVEWDEYTGRFAAKQTVEVQARVNGYLTKVNFTDGQLVKEGDLLFEIDPRPFERALEQASAELDQAKVRVSNATLDVERARPLLKQEHISQKTFDDRENLVREGAAAIKVAEARVKAAELELSFTRISAPISGRIGRAFATKGNFVSGGNTDSGATVLAVIVTQDPIYIYFDVSQNDALKYARLAKSRGGGIDGLIGSAVEVGLPDEKKFPHEGKLNFLDNRLDESTGTLRARGALDNKSGLFSPGMFARVRLQGSDEYLAVMLPDEAIGTDQASRFVYVVGDDDVPVRKVVELGPLVDGLRVIRSGLEPEDWVIVRGQQRVRPGEKITPKRTPLTVSAASKGQTGSLSKP
jgi:RND family efflux transporter MFP subunit